MSGVRSHIHAEESEDRDLESSLSQSDPQSQSQSRSHSQAKPNERSPLLSQNEESQGFVQEFVETAQLLLENAHPFYIIRQVTQYQSENNGNHKASAAHLPQEQQQQQQLQEDPEYRRKHTAIARTLNLIRGSRVVSFALWLSLIGQYFYSVDGHFAERVCLRPNFPDQVAISYCSNDYQLYPEPGRCVMTGNMCHVSLLESVPTLIFLSIMQLNIFMMRVLTSSVAIKMLKALLRFDLVLIVFVFLLFCQHLFLFVTFIIEGFALPLGTKDGLFAFQPWDSYGLNITCIVAIPLLFAPFIIRFLPESIREYRIKMRISSWAHFGYLLAISVVSIHSLVSALAYAVNHWDFVSASMFFIAWQKSFLSYRVTRTLFSIAAIVETILSFSLFNQAKRLEINPDKIADQHKFGLILNPFGLNRRGKRENPRQ